MESPPFRLHQPIEPIPASEYLLRKELIVAVLDTRMRLTAQKGMLLESLKTYHELAGLTPLEPDDPRVAFAARLEAALESNALLRADIELSEEKTWRHELFRHQFTLQRVEGEIDGMKLNCTGREQLLQYRPQWEWTIPAHWGDCALTVTGKAGTHFEIVELPGTPSPG